MKLAQYRQWYQSKKWFEQLFLFLLLLRPIVEPYFYLKKSSPILSPLYWIAILTFFICITGIVSSLKFPSKLDRSFGWWVLFVVLNTFCLALSSEVLTFFIFSLKLIYPVLLFYFLRTFIHRKTDLYGLLITLVVSSFFASLWFLKDIASIGLNLRDQSSFADVVNYGFYINFALIIVMYFFLKGKTILFTNKKTTIYLILTVLLLSIATHWGIKHMASIAVMFVIVILFLFYLVRKKTPYSLFFISLVVASVLYFGKSFYNEVINERLVKEIEVAEGERRQGQGFHGRISRWTWLKKEFTTAETYSQFVGYPTTLKYSAHMIGITPHNDFLRILFFTGFIGLFFFLRFIFLIAIRIRYLNQNDKFLAIGAIFIFILYSLSTVPTFYPGFNNFIFAIFAFLALPLKKFHEED